VNFSEARIDPVKLFDETRVTVTDLASLRAAKIDNVPDAVALPANRAELDRVLAWAQTSGHAVIPFGGGSSVVGGVNAEGMGEFPGVVTLSLGALNQVLDVDTRSRTVHAEAGILGPDLEDALRPHGLAVRHFPQSYFHSTLGGWVATRGAGHFSTLLAKIEDRVQALGVTLPDGRRAETRRLPASSIGPDPNRLWCGSEGTLGIITDVHLRCVGLPAERVSAGVRFKTFEQALEAARALLQAGIYPQVIVSDDGLQHHALGRDLEICVFDRRGIGNGWLLPAGPLREPASRLRSVDALVTNGGAPVDLEGVASYRMRVQGERLVNLPRAETAAPARFAGQRVHAVAGIGNPRRFFERLRMLGLDIRPQPFPDHHPFTAEDLAFAADDPVLMTEKDAVKCAAFARESFWYLPVDAEVDPALGTHLLDELEAIHGRQAA